MKPIAVFVLVAAFAAAGIAAGAKTVTSSHSTADETSVIGVAGPAPAGNKPVAVANTSQPSKKALKKTKIKAPPPMHDPN